MTQALTTQRVAARITSGERAGRVPSPPNIQEHMKDYPYALDGGSLDPVVSKRVDEPTKRRKIRFHLNRMLHALGEQKHLYFPVESLQGELQDRREDAYYAIGFERGSGTLSPKEREMVRAIRKMIQPLPIAERARVLVAAAHHIEPKELL